jgi:hypothetical protein
MRELTRSLASFSWAISLFGVEQMANLLSPCRAANALGAVARSAEGALGPGLRSAFRAGDNLQRAVVDASFSLVGLGGPSANGGNSAQGATPGTDAPGVLSQAGNLAFELLQLGVDSVYWASGTAWQQQKGPSGWGQVPPSQDSSSRK